MKKIITPKEAAELIPDGASVMFGGFMGCGNAHKTVAEMAALGRKGMTLISNDASMQKGPDGSTFYGIAQLVHNKQFDKVIASHVGLNPEIAEQMNAGTLDVTLIPQGSLVEMIRAGGAGLGGILTPTGYGTIVQEASHVHSVVDIDGKPYLLERPIKADFALLCGFKVDRAGNVWYKGTTRNFSVAMATAAKTVIVEADNLVEIGEIEPENVMTQGILVDYIVSGKGA
ncbi:MAG: 3-oxoacid CoA-transferase subunit A [Planctomycetaceae bacterium]|nr:3-oxoacid CoA-transferase subunit A [Planctomycetaceae bacterium]